MRKCETHIDTWIFRMMLMHRDCDEDSCLTQYLRKLNSIFETNTRNIKGRDWLIPTNKQGQLGKQLLTTNLSQQRISVRMLLR